VTRRDGADALGDAAAKAVEILRAYSKDADVDVASAVNRALERISGAVAGVAPKPGSRDYTLEELVAGVEKEGKRSVQSHDDGYAVDVRLKNGRNQKVYISPSHRSDGTKLVRVFTYCGEPTEDAMRWALETNMKLSQGALALHEEGGTEHFVLVNCYIASEATPTEVKASVKELAFYGDWIEQRLSGLDDF